MKKIFAILALIGIATVGVAQNIKAGLYDKQGNAVVVEAEPITVNVTLRVATEQFKPGVYARYAQKYLGKGSQWQTIYNANKEIIEQTAKKYGKSSSNNGYWIFPGITLTIPQ